MEQSRNLHGVFAFHLAYGLKIYELLLTNKSKWFFVFASFHHFNVLLIIVPLTVFIENKRECHSEYNESCNYKPDIDG
jgi:hypothetical protein